MPRGIILARFVVKNQTNDVTIMAFKDKNTWFKSVTSPLGNLGETPKGENSAIVPK